ncbi:MAG: hypothetical protein QNJ62_06635 [Methyloceanibacter sp.]|nr:hypothetical protein [Methyloceanibacter sp.]
MINMIRDMIANTLLFWAMRVTPGKRDKQRIAAFRAAEFMIKRQRYVLEREEWKRRRTQ